MYMSRENIHSAAQLGDVNDELRACSFHHLSGDFVNIEYCTRKYNLMSFFLNSKGQDCNISVGWSESL